MSDANKEKEQKLHNLRGGIFLACVTGASLICGFGLTFAMAKRRDPHFFQKGLIKSEETIESGGSLAMRALARGTLYAVGGFSLLIGTAWAALGLKSIKDVPEKMKSLMPTVPEMKSSGRSDFRTFRELMEYLENPTKSNRPK